MQDTRNEKRAVERVRHCLEAIEQWNPRVNVMITVDAEGALEAARWACRLRRRSGIAIVSLKGPAESGTGGWLHRRPELEGPATPEPVPERWSPSDARTLLDRLRGGNAISSALRAAPATTMSGATTTTKARSAAISKAVGRRSRLALRRFPTVGTASWTTELIISPP